MQFLCIDYLRMTRKKKEALVIIAASVLVISLKLISETMPFNIIGGVIWLIFAITYAWFIIFKFYKVITWSWWWVTVPFWGGLVILLILILFFGEK